MKRFVLCLFILASFHSARSQELGLRFGSNVGSDVAIDGVFALGQFSRIHADVSFHDGVGIEALWNPLFRPLTADVPGLHWYLGVGPWVFIGDPFSFGAAGEIGLEYRFSEVPIAIGADWRPTLRIIDDTDMFWDRFGLNIRWVFGGGGGTTK